ncbi:MAG: ATP-binding protein [Candidatus Eisenbacteria bacterium]
MRSKRVAYLPITSIVIGIVLLAITVAFISYRDIGRGREQLSEILWYQARGILSFTRADLRAELMSPAWRPTRINTFFEEVSSTHPGIAYLALLDSDGRIVVHSDSVEVGRLLPEADVRTDVRGDPRGVRRIGLPGGHGPTGVRVDIAVGTRIVETGGRRVYEYRVSIDLPPPAAADHRLRQLGRSRMGPPGRLALVTPADPELVRARLEELLGRPVDPNAPVPITAVVGLDATELEAAFHSSRNYTLMLAGVLLLVGGTAIYFLFIIATHRSTRTALENMRSYTSNIIESMTSGLVSLDATGHVVTVNAGARAILGLGAAVVDGADVNDVMRVDHDADRAEVDRVLTGEREVLETETRVVGRAGSVPVALSASSLWDEEGERAGTVLLFQDLREIEELKEAVERERHLASLGRLAAGVAHEVRNPLSSLKGFAQFFRTKFEPGSEEERYSDIMIEEVERLDRVVQELLDFARPVAPDRTQISSGTMIEEALALVSEDAQFKRVSIEMKLGEGLPDVLVDPMQIRQALLNVLLNAIEAMGEGGTLTIETSVSGSTDGPPTVTIGVTDTGEGMSEEEVGKLFEPFYTTKPRGTGLGLTVVSRVVEQNGGRVGVRSSQGQGTTFSLVLPVAGETKSRENGGGTPL